MRAAPSAQALFDGLERVANSLERSAQVALDTDSPLACTASELALETLVRAATDELGSVRVSINASSSFSLLAGDVRAARLRTAGVSILGLRASAIDLYTEQLELDIGTPFVRPPNLARPVAADFSLRLTGDDLNRSPVLFAALQELLRQLLRTAASAAMGQVLPQSEALRVSLVRVESLQAGRITLLANGLLEQRDGTTLTLEGMRVRTLVRVDKLERLVVLDRPELLSAFEGWGARLEVGLPFLRGAGLPLPEGLSLEALDVAEGLVIARGTLQIQPVDYAQLFETPVAVERPAPQTIDVPSPSPPTPPSNLQSSSPRLPRSSD